MIIHNLDMGFSRAYLIETEVGLYLIDAGMPGMHGKVLRFMQSIGRDDLKMIFLTHAHLDHYGSAKNIRDQTGASIVIHSDDVEALKNGETRLGDVRGRGKYVKYLLPVLERFYRLEPVEPDMIFEHGDRFDYFGLDALLIHLPGHTLGSSALLTSEGHAFVGDLLSTSGKPHVQRYYASDWTQIKKSLLTLYTCQPSQIFPGHGSRPLSGDELKSMVELQSNIRDYYE